MVSLVSSQLELNMKKLFWLALPILATFIYFQNQASGASVTITVNVPATTPQDSSLSLGGDFNSWNPTSFGYQLDKMPNGQYQYKFTSIKAGTVLNFKITRGDWDSVEIADDGSNRDNRRILVENEDKKLELTVADWADLSTKQAPSTIVGEVILEDIELPTFSGNRHLRIYLPPNYQTSKQRYPVIYMTDAQNLYDRKTANAGEWQMDELMQQLAKNDSALTSIVVGIDHASDNRRLEYLPFKTDSFQQAKGGDFANWMVNELKPYIDKQYRTKPQRQYTSMLGSSMGGLITCYTVLTHQEVFSKAGCLSSAFLKRLVDEEWLDYIKRSHKRLPTKFHMDMGDNEFGLFGDNILKETQEVHDAFISAGFDNSEIRNQVIKGGTHDEPSWRDRTLDILTWLNQ